MFTLNSSNIPGSTTLYIPSTNTTCASPNPIHLSIAITVSLGTSLSVNIPSVVPLPFTHHYIVTVRGTICIQTYRCHEVSDAVQYMCGQIPSLCVVGISKGCVAVFFLVRVINIYFPSYLNHSTFFLASAVTRGGGGLPAWPKTRPEGADPWRPCPIRADSDVGFDQGPAPLREVEGRGRDSRRRAFVGVQ